MNSTAVVAPSVTDDPEPLFGIDIAYGYAESQNLADFSENGRTFQVVVNYTRLSEVETCDAIYEVHQIEVYSCEMLIGTLTKAQGIMFNTSKSTLMQGMSLNLDDFSAYGEVPPGASASWPVNLSALLFFGNDKPCVYDFGDPTTVSVRVSRLGLVTLKDGVSEVEVLSCPEVVAEVQLETFEDGFLYNTVIAEDELAEIDPFDPFMWIFSD